MENMKKCKQITFTQVFFLLTFAIKTVVKAQFIFHLHLTESLTGSYGLHYAASLFLLLKLT